MEREGKKDQNHTVEEDKGRGVEEVKTGEEILKKLINMECKEESTG